MEIDRDYDGRVDGFYIYERGTLAREEHDTDGDGVVDRQVLYEKRLRTEEITRPFCRAEDPEQRRALREQLRSSSG